METSSLPQAPTETPPPIAQEERPVGMRMIIAYKFIKSPISLTLAIALTFAPAKSYSAVLHVLGQMSELGSLMAKAAHWMTRHLSHDITGRAAALAWLDGLSTGIEGILLATGKAWAEWVVVAVLACLVPPEIIAFMHRKTALRAGVVVVNVLVVAYLAWRRVQAEREHLAKKHAQQHKTPES